jgi:glycine dehydrogenase
MGAELLSEACQRFGIPMFYGGPSGRILATRTMSTNASYRGVSSASPKMLWQGALRMALQSVNSISNVKSHFQYLYGAGSAATMSSFYAVYPGPEGLKKFAAAFTPSLPCK